MFYKVYTTPSSFPEPVNLNGLFTSVGVNITTTTPSALIVGDWLYSTSNNEVRKIATISGDNNLTIESAFTVDVTNEQIKIADKSVSYEKISISNIGAADGLLNGYDVAMGQTINIEESGVAFSIDGTGTKIAISATS